MLCAVEVLDQDQVDRATGFAKRMHWFIENRKDLRRHISYAESGPHYRHGARLLATPSRMPRARAALHAHEKDFLSPYGLRSLSRYHLEHPYVLDDGDGHGGQYQVRDVPGEIPHRRQTCVSRNTVPFWNRIGGESTSRPTATFECSRS